MNLLLQVVRVDPCKDTSWQRKGGKVQVSLYIKRERESCKFVCNIQTDLILTNSFCEPKRRFINSLSVFFIQELGIMKNLLKWPILVYRDVSFQAMA